MKRVIAISLLLALLSVSCNKTGGGSSSDKSTEKTSPSTADTTGTTQYPGTVTPTPAPTPASPASSTLPDLALSFLTNVTLMSFTAGQGDNYNQAIA